MLRRSHLLVTEHQYAVLQQQAADFAHLGGIGNLRELHAADLRTDRRRETRDGEPRRGQGHRGWG
jgi:hypothetical protein